MSRYTDYVAAVFNLKQIWNVKVFKAKLSIKSSSKFQKKNFQILIRLNNAKYSVITANCQKVNVFFSYLPYIQKLSALTKDVLYCLTFIIVISSPFLNTFALKMDAAKLLEYFFLLCQSRSFVRISIHYVRTFCKYFL